MCGLYGEIRFDGRPVDPGRLQVCGDAMAPRGPDGAGLIARGPVALGHRRLKIIDLSDAAEQPMVDANLGLTIVFNGAIYNYPELRRELQGMGYTFFSSGDTEVILKAWHAWREKSVERFNGMFAFAIWERETGRVTLGRDRLGIKPLYLADGPGALRFASALPALVRAGGVDTDVDPVALNHYMSFHAVVPAPHTIFRGVRKLPPGSLLICEPNGTMTEKRFWTVDYDGAEDDLRLSEDDWRERILDGLRAAVMRRSVADVPVGVLLSGGLDSSLITGLLAEQGASDLNTFSIGFESVGNEQGDEFSYSDLVAKHFGTRHHKLFVDSRKVLPEMPNCIAAMNEPMVSHDNIGFFLLSREVAKHVNVVQSGQGADEVFGGYHWYPPLLESDDPVADYARVFFDRDYEEYRRAVHPRFHDGDHARAFVEAHFAQPGASRPVDKALRIDTNVMLVDDPVKRVDNMTMASSLEARVPFLDHELVELASRCPAEYKLAQDGKGILKEAARQVIPHEVIDRPKGYFPVPALKYLQGPYLEMVRDAVTSKAARERDLFDPGYVDMLLDDPEAHITPLRGSKLWQIGLLEMWLRTHAA